MGARLCHSSLSTYIWCVNTVFCELTVIHLHFVRSAFFSGHLSPQVSPSVLIICSTLSIKVPRSAAISKYAKAVLAHTWGFVRDHRALQLGWLFQSHSYFSAFSSPVIDSLDTGVPGLNWNVRLCIWKVDVRGPSADALNPHDYDGCWECDEGSVTNG